jgi:hypothetical protein
VMIRCRLVAGASPISTVPLLLQMMMPVAAHRLYYSGQPNPSVNRDQGRNHVRLPLDGCRNIDDVLKLVDKHIDNLPTNQAAAAWSFMSCLLSKEQRNGRDLRRTRIDDVQRPEQREQQLQLFFQHTMSSLDKLRYRDLTTIIFSMAKIVKSIRAAQERKGVSTYHHALRNIFQKSNPFGHFANAADAKVITFDARYMSNIAELLECESCRQNTDDVCCKAHVKSCVCLCTRWVQSRV